MRFEDVLHEAGDFGKFQFWVLGLLFMPRIIIPLHFMLHNFLGLVPPHHCTIPAQDSLKNLTENVRLTVSIPKESDGTFSSCKMFLESQFHLLSNSSQEIGNISSITQCKDGWQYNNTQVKSSIVSEHSIYLLEICPNHLNFNMNSRKKLNKILRVMQRFPVPAREIPEIALIEANIAYELENAAMTPETVESLEWIALQKRTFHGTITGLAWCIGNMLLPLIAYYITEWRWFIFTVTMPNAVAILICWWVPESARWLLITGKIEMAEKALQKCASVNGRMDFSSRINKEALTKVVTLQEPNKGLSYLYLVKTPKMRKLALFSGIMWFGVVFTYYGISLKITGFGLNIYLTQFIYAAIEVPAKIITYFMLDRTGRRQGQAWSLIAAGAMIAVTAAIPLEFGLARSLVAIIGKGLSEMAFTVALLYTAELYPTILRQTGIGYTGFVGRIGSSIAPLIILLEDTWFYLPYIIFSFGAFICGAAAFFLPETTNVNLPETVDDIEQGSHMFKTSNHPGQHTDEIFKIARIQNEEQETRL
ncbi:solute carrier family 22 member 7-like [Protopterus annectens]|uniref:solute carrier family 22 member 7-like n=1 Tax=Protopterus annectens TaxID=7888 RepID=UPI001CFAC769|nr:solute carrier family 22 member 7-like [Protopterus annectens]